MASDIYDLVNKATQSDSKMSKVQLGYTVDTYQGVLAELKQIYANVGSYGGAAMGDDYDSIGNMRWDDNDFSIHSTACLWKMDMSLFGSLPIRYANGQNGIVQVKGMNSELVSKTGNNEILPLALSSDVCLGLSDTHQFPSGVYIDIDGKGVKYFNQFFNGANQSEPFDAKMIHALVNKRCLMAQIIPTTGNNKTCEAIVIGKTPNSNTATSHIMVSPAMFATSGLSQLGLPITMSGQGKRITILPNSSDGDYRCLIEGSAYNTKTGTIKNFDISSYKKWATRNAQMSGQAEALEIDQFQGQTCYVRLYIPANKREIAQNIIPEGVSDAIYQTYSAARYGAGNIPAGLNADVRRMMECITLACQEFGCKLYTSADIKDARSVPAAMSGNGGWIRGHGQATAMAGYFYIPQGWPMCRINQNYGNRSGENQRRKGHPKQGSGSAVPWVECDSDERMDTALQKLDTTILSGNKDREWYNERLRRSNLGQIKIYCNSAVADKWQQVFVKSMAVYAAAAAKYNLGRSSDEQVSAGEILLRCAPCLCCINGNSPVHRARDSRKGGHEGGQAIDFAPDLNYATASFSANLSTPFAAGMEVAYRPWLHYMFEQGGGWGGAYKFMGTKFDSMHFQIG